MKKLSQTIIIFLLSNIISFSQITFEKTIGDIAFQQGWSVQQTNDGGYIIGGDTYIGSECKIYLVKTDQYGDTVWTRTYGNHQWDDLPYLAFQTNDGGYIIGPTYCSNSAADTLDLYLIKTDQLGNIVWEKKYDNNGNDDIGNYLQQTSDSGFVLVGSSTNETTGNSSVYVIKTDPNGNVQWEKTIQDSIGITTIQELEQGGYIMCGVEVMTLNFVLIKLDTIGNIIWNRTYNKNLSPGYPFLTVRQTSDSGFILFSSTTLSSNTYSYLFKTNDNGDSLWAKTTFQNAGFFCGEQNDDGEYIMTGGIDSGNSDFDLFIVKTDTSGNYLWNKTFGDSYDDYGLYINQTNDGGCIVTGIKNYGSGNSDIYLIKTNENGFVRINEILNKEESFQIYPNPFNEFINIRTGKKDISVKIYNMKGQLLSTYSVENRKNSIMEINTSKYPKGLYFIKVNTIDSYKITKIIKQ